MIIKATKKLITIMVALVLAVAFFFLPEQNRQPEPSPTNEPPLGANEPVGAGEESLFAEIDADGNVLRVIVIDANVLNTGVWGDPKNWVRTYANGRQRKNYAGGNYKYDKTKDAFIPPKPGGQGDWVLDEATLNWKIQQ